MASIRRSAIIARYYDPTIAQFLTVDPDVATTLSPYGYVQGDPLNGTDPSGDCGLWGSDTCLGDAAGWVNNHVVQPVANYATHLCIRTGGGNWNSNVGGSLFGNGECQTVLSSSQGVEAEASIAVTISGAAGTSYLAGVMSDAAGQMAAEDAVLGIPEWETQLNIAHLVWGGGAFVLGVPVALTGIIDWMLYNAFTSCHKG